MTTEAGASKRANVVLRSYALPLLRSFRNAYRYARFVHQFRQFSRAHNNETSGLMLKWSDRMACVHDASATTPFDPHYIYHPAWAARMVAAAMPSVHVDISSTLAFCTMLSAFVPVEFYDYRPAHLKLDGLKTQRADLTRLHFPDNSIVSLSCMHVLEHVGLGRYGEELDPAGDAQASKELVRVLAPGGRLLVVVPAGRPRIVFNAHRVYSHERVLDMFRSLILEDWHLLPDGMGEDGLLHRPSPEVVARQSYGCGCYVFTKK